MRAKYRDCAHLLTSLIQQHETSVEKRIVDANNLGVFCSFVNKRLFHKTGITAVTDPNGVTLSDDKDIANAFYDYFAYVGVPSNNSTPHSYNPDVPLLHSVDVGDHDILVAVNKLKSNLSAGPDGFPPMLFKRTKFSICEPLVLLYRQLLSVACVPDVWENAVATPLHKKGPGTVISNYRPISVTCVPCRVLERVVVSKIYNHLMENNILCVEQHGFVRGRSTCTNLLESLNDLDL